MAFSEIQKDIGYRKPRLTETLGIYLEAEKKRKNKLVIFTRRGLYKLVVFTEFT